MLNHTTASAILARTKPHISEYFLFSLKLWCKAIFLVEDQASFPGILSAQNNKGEKWCLCSRHSWRHLYFFYLSALARAFSGVMRKQNPASKLMMKISNNTVVPCLQSPWEPTLARVSSGASPLAPLPMLPRLDCCRMTSCPYGLLDLQCFLSGHLPAPSTLLTR